jgi:hypothetical protein
VATTPGNSWNLLETPGIVFTPGKYSWKLQKLLETPGKLLEFRNF